MSVDIVVSSTVFHHLNRKIKQGALREAMRIVNSGGLFLLCNTSVPVNERGPLLVRWLAKMETGAARQGAGELLEIAAAESLAMVSRWTRVSCITQYEIRAMLVR